MKIDKIAVIKDRLTMRDVLNRYGFKLQKDFICCPFHSEKTPSMRIHKKYFYCFGCGEQGDVITFVQKLFNLSFSDTLKKIDTDFNLGLYREKTLEDLRKSRWQSRQIKAKQERIKAEKQHADDEYWKVFDEWKRLDDNKQDYAPKCLEDMENPHPLFVEACQKLAYQEYLLECAEIRRSEKNERH